jgi:hypothetical protein
MAEIDDELIACALRWCADAGRHATAAAVRDALAPLSWDELLAARALLADPPPSRPLGPFALADLARGALPDVAAEREREERYGAARSALPAPSGAAPPATRPARARRGKPRGAASPVVRRARDRVAPSIPVPAPLPAVDLLHESEGRVTLERLVRERGARRAALLEALAAGWRRRDGSAPVEEDLDALLAAHGLARGFAHRERDEALHVLRAAGGLKRRASAALGLAPAALDAALARLGATADAEAIREARRRELRHRATLSERVRLVIAEAEALSDLEVLAEFEADLRARLPEHLRALRAAEGTDVAEALARSLDVGDTELCALAERLGLALAAPRAGAPRAAAPGRERPASRSTSSSAASRAVSYPAKRSASSSAKRGVPRDRGGARRPPRPKR